MNNQKDNLIRLRLSGASDNELRANIAAFNGDLKGMQKYFFVRGVLGGGAKFKFALLLEIGPSNIKINIF